MVANDSNIADFLIQKGLKVAANKDVCMLDGVVSGVFFYTRDVTEQQEMKAALYK